MLYLDDVVIVFKCDLFGLYEFLIVIVLQWCTQGLLDRIREFENCIVR